MSAGDPQWLSPGRPIHALQLPRWRQLGLAAARFVRPLEPEREAALERQWNSLDPQWRTPYQAFGRKMTGCGATIGLHPRCDFACTGCYLGEEANKIPPLPLAAVLQQLERIRDWTGPKGNVQITDGEVTLRPLDELLAVLRRCHELELIPMLMTHGDSLRRRDGLLERLCVEGGLTEISIHIDITMRGRVGYKHVTREEDLEPLRDEFAAMLRRVRRETGSAIRAATTMTVTRENLDGVAHVARWSALNRDVFKLLSLQPVADVGRTSLELQAVTPDECWQRVAEGLSSFTNEVGVGGPIHVGHPECNRVASFLCVQRAGRPARFVKTVRSDQDDDRKFLEAMHATGLMGVGYRGDAPLVGLGRKLGAALQALGFVLGTGQRFLRARLRDAGENTPAFLLGLITGQVQVSGFTVVSHHFMGRSEIGTATGQARLAACVFKLPVGDSMLSMCEVNLLGARAQMYAAIREAPAPQLPAESATQPYTPDLSRH